MKSFSKILSSLFAAVTLMTASSAQALFLGPGTPTLDGVTDALFGTEIVGSTMNNVNTGLIMKVQGEIQDIKAKYNEYKNDYEGVMLKEKAPLEGTRTIKRSSKANPADPQETRRAVYDLFLAEPSTDFFEQRDYQAQATRFYQDTLIEVNTAVNRLEQEYNNNLKEKINQMSEDMLTGENGAEVSADENGSWKNDYNAYKTFDDLVQILEELTALKAQLVAAKAIKDDLTPVPAPDDGTKGETASGEENKETKESTDLRTATIKLAEARTASYQKNEVLAFAQQSSGISYRYNPDENGIMSFVEAPESGLDSPFASGRDELKDIERLNPVYNTAVKTLKIHNLIQSLPAKKALFDKYKQYRKLHDKAIEKVGESDQCVLRYLGKYYQNPEKTWYGAYIGDQIADYDLRKGISGWAISSYETAKAAIANPVEEADLAELELDAEMDSTDFESFAEQVPYVEEKSENFDGYKEQSKYDENDTNTRMLELVPWNVGAEAAKELANDQRADNPEWGVPKTFFPVWNDQKSFFGQYLDGKYDNIKRYLSYFDFRVRTVSLAGELNTLSDAEPLLKQYAAQRLSSMAAALKDVSEIPEDGNFQITSAAAEKKEAVEILQQNLAKALEQQENSRKELVGQMDALQTRQDDLNRQINRGQNASMNDNAEVPEDVDVNALKQEISSVEKQIDEVQKQIDKVDEKTALLRKAYIRKEQNIEQQYSAYVAGIKDPVLKTLAAIVMGGSPALAGMTPDLQLKAQSYFAWLIGTSETIFADVKDYAQEAVDRARNDIYGYGEIIYFPKGESQILARHIALINELKNLPFDQLSQSKPSVLQIAASPTAVELVTTAFQPALLEVICLNNLCEQPDSDYFIGASPKVRDFSAPKGAPDTSSAPPREIIHLDYIDYENIPKLPDNSVAKADILKYGQPVPEVWKYMLKNPAYVEKDIDLEKALTRGGEELTFMRGGSLPCRDGDTIIDARDDKAAYYTVTDSDNRYSYLECLFLKTGIGNGNILLGNTVLNLEAEKDQLVKAEKKSDVAGANPSELGIFLKYEDNKLYVRDMPVETYKRLKEIQEDDSSEEEYKENVPDNIYKKAAFSENQIGNFLRFVDMEMEYRQILEELSAKIEETKADLFAEFKEAGFTPSEDFDLSNEEDYKQARETLDGLKNNNITAAEEMLEDIANPENDVVNDRKIRVENVINALKQDETELLSLSEDDAPGSTLDERLKTEQANQETAQKYQEEADKAFEDMLNNFPAPYCASY